MSHFTVLVIGDNVEDQLAPYDENKEADPRVESEDYLKALTDALEWLFREPTQEQIDRGMGFTETEVELRVRLDSRRTPEELTPEETLDVLTWYDSSWQLDPDGKYRSYTTYNPLSKWDWYQIGGRWSGFFYVKPGSSEDDYRPSHQHWTEREPGSGIGVHDGPVKPGLTDQARKKVIDFELMRKNAEIEALQNWEKFEAATKGLTSPGSWQDFRKARLGNLAEKEFHELTSEEREQHERLMQEARQAYGSLPFIKATRELAGFFSDPHTLFRLDAPDPKSAYVQHRVNTVTTPYAVLKDGEWISKGDMGLFGISVNEEDQDAWDARVNELIDSLPEDTLLTLVDCHI